ncbi:hypothetical protein [Micromonospora sp. NPDC049662]|uniref:hypothetical protein n=1 Tax=Micromonospora sp. NPDC049662 TaxID=3155397 RepID=UPI00343926A3
MSTTPDLSTEPPGLPADVAARVRTLADQLHGALRDEMLRKDPAPEVLALWQTAKLINAAAGGLDDHGEPETSVHTSRWVEVAFNASDIADTALRITGSRMSLPDAAAYVERADVDALDVPFNAATAYAATVELTPAHDGEDYALPVTVAVAGDPERTLTVAGRPNPRPYTAGQLLRVAHHLDRLGAALGDVVIGASIDKPADDGGQ